MRVFLVCLVLLGTSWAGADAISLSTLLGFGSNTTWTPASSDESPSHAHHHHGHTHAHNMGEKNDNNGRSDHANHHHGHVHHSMNGDTDNQLRPAHHGHAHHSMDEELGTLPSPAHHRHGHVHTNRDSDYSPHPQHHRHAHHSDQENNAMPQGHPNSHRYHAYHVYHENDPVPQDHPNSYQHHAHHNDLHENEDDNYLGYPHPHHHLHNRNHTHPHYNGTNHHNHNHSHHQTRPHPRPHHHHGGPSKTRDRRIFKFDEPMSLEARRQRNQWTSDSDRKGTLWPWFPKASHTGPRPSHHALDSPHMSHHASITSHGSRNLYTYPFTMSVPPYAHAVPLYLHIHQPSHHTHQHPQHLTYHRMHHPYSPSHDNLSPHRDHHHHGRNHPYPPLPLGPPIPPPPPITTTRRRRCPMLYSSIGDRCIAIFSIARMPWNDAKHFCDGIFGELFTFSNVQEYRDMVVFLQTAGLNSPLWVGGREGPLGWQWVNYKFMPRGTPYWAVRPATRSSATTKQRSANRWSQSIYSGWSSDARRCAAMNADDYYYLSDAECDDYKAPVCVLKDDAEVVVARGDFNDYQYPALEPGRCYDWMVRDACYDNDRRADNESSDESNESSEEDSSEEESSEDSSEESSKEDSSEEDSSEEDSSEEDSSEEDSSEEDSSEEDSSEEDSSDESSEEQSSEEENSTKGSNEGKESTEANGVEVTEENKNNGKLEGQEDDDDEEEEENNDNDKENGSGLEAGDGTLGDDEDMTYGSGDGTPKFSYVWDEEYYDDAYNRWDREDYNAVNDLFLHG